MLHGFDQGDIGTIKKVGIRENCIICGSSHHTTNEHGLAFSKKTANDRQVGGDHYKTDGLQHWDIVHMFKLDYFQGQITKYLFRWRKKNGLEDLEKARHYLDKYIELERGKRDLEANASRAGAPAGNEPAQRD